MSMTEDQYAVDNLKDELLRVYRAFFAVTHERDRFKALHQSARRKKEEAEAESARLLDHNKFLRHDYDELMEENGSLLDRICEYRNVVDTTLDLAGAVVEEDAKQDQITANILAAIRTGAPIPLPPEVMATCPDSKAPFNCLSCGGTKEEDFYYLCERCFDLDTQCDFGLLDELMRDWELGRRDFPRKGKNAKELASAD